MKPTKLIIEIDLNHPHFRRVDPVFEVRHVASLAVSLVCERLTHNHNNYEHYYSLNPDPLPIIEEGHILGSMFLTSSLLGDDAARAMKRAEELFGASIVHGWLVDSKPPKE